VKRDLIFSDNESSFKTEMVKDLEQHHGVYRRYFPPQMGHLLDPCDNSFHASVHKRYWSKLSRYQHPDLSTQIKIIHDSYFAEKESIIRSYFEKCGIIGNTQPIKRILNRLFYDGLYPTSKFRDLHKNQLNAYLDWRFSGTKTIEDIFGSKFEHLFSQKR